MTEISDRDRILLFEWQATHFESWNQHCFPATITVNHPLGMDSPTYHAVSTRMMLMRKFYLNENVRLDRVATSISNELTVKNGPLHKTLEWVSLDFRNNIAQSDVFVADKPNTAEDIFFDTLYGLLLHSDPDRAKRLIDGDTGWHHNALFVQNGAEPIFRTLNTIRQCRADCTLVLPDPHRPVWEQQLAYGMSLDEIEAFLKGGKSTTPDS